MRKTLVLLLATAFVATLPSLASAKSKRHHRHQARAVAVQPMYPEDAGPRFVANALYQLVVPWEQTFGPRHYR